MNVWLICWIQQKDLSTDNKLIIFWHKGRCNSAHKVQWLTPNFCENLQLDRDLFTCFFYDVEQIKACLANSCCINFGAKYISNYVIFVIWSMQRNFTLYLKKGKIIQGTIHFLIKHYIYMKCHFYNNPCKQICLCIWKM